MLNDGLYGLPVDPALFALQRGITPEGAMSSEIMSEMSDISLRAERGAFGRLMFSPTPPPLRRDDTIMTRRSVSSLAMSDTELVRCDIKRLQIEFKQREDLLFSALEELRDQVHAKAPRPPQQRPIKFGPTDIQTSSVLIIQSSVRKFIAKQLVTRLRKTRRTRPRCHAADVLAVPEDSEPRCLYEIRLSLVIKNENHIRNQLVRLENKHFSNQCSKIEIQIKFRNSCEVIIIERRDGLEGFRNQFIFEKQELASIVIQKWFLSIKRKMNSRLNSISSSVVDQIYSSGDAFSPTSADTKNHLKMVYDENDNCVYRSSVLDAQLDTESDMVSFSADLYDPDEELKIKHDTQHIPPQPIKPLLSKASSFSRAIAITIAPPKRFSDKHKTSLGTRTSTGSEDDTWGSRSPLTAISQPSPLAPFESNVKALYLSSALASTLSFLGKDKNSSVEGEECIAKTRGGYSMSPLIKQSEPRLLGIKKEQEVPSDPTASVDYQQSSENVIISSESEQNSQHNLNEEIHQLQQCLSATIPLEHNTHEDNDLLVRSVDFEETSEVETSPKRNSEAVKHHQLNKCLSSATIPLEREYSADMEDPSGEDCRHKQHQLQHCLSSATIPLEHNTHEDNDLLVRSVDFEETSEGETFAKRNSEEETSPKRNSEAVKHHQLNKCLSSATIPLEREYSADLEDPSGEDCRHKQHQLQHCLSSATIPLEHNTHGDNDLLARSVDFEETSEVEASPKRNSEAVKHHQLNKCLSSATIPLERECSADLEDPSGEDCRHKQHQLQHCLSSATIPLEHNTHEDNDLLVRSVDFEETSEGETFAKRNSEEETSPKRNSEEETSPKRNSEAVKHHQLNKCLSSATIPLEREYSADLEDPSGEDCRHKQHQLQQCLSSATIPLEHKTHEDNDLLVRSVDFEETSEGETSPKRNSEGETFAKRNSEAVKHHQLNKCLSSATIPLEREYSADLEDPSGEDCRHKQHQLQQCLSSATIPLEHNTHGEVESSSPTNGCSDDCQQLSVKGVLTYCHSHNSSDVTLPQKPEVEYNSAVELPIEGIVTISQPDDDVSTADNSLPEITVQVESISHDHLFVDQKGGKLFGGSTTASTIENASFLGLSGEHQNATPEGTGECSFTDEVRSGSFNDNRSLGSLGSFGTAVLSDLHKSVRRADLDSTQKYKKTRRRSIACSSPVPDIDITDGENVSNVSDYSPRFMGSTCDSESYAEIPDNIIHEPGGIYRIEYRPRIVGISLAMSGVLLSVVLAAMIATQIDVSPIVMSPFVLCVIFSFIMIYRLGWSCTLRFVDEQGLLLCKSRHVIFPCVRKSQTFSYSSLSVAIKSRPTRTGLLHCVVLPTVTESVFPVTCSSYLGVSLIETTDKATADVWVDFIQDRLDYGYG